MGQSGVFAYVVKDDMTVELRPVVAGDTWQQVTVVEEGLQPGETVVIDGLLRAAPGLKVRIVADQAETKDES